MKFRKGDKVSAVGVVGYASADGATIEVRFKDTIEASELTLVERKFEPGEMVFDSDDRAGSVWEVVGVNGVFLWMKRSDGHYRTAPAAMCLLATEVEVDSINADPDFAEVDDAPLPPPDPPRSGLDDEKANSAPGKCITAKAGDTLSVLALVHGTTAAELANLNGIELTAHLEAGQVLELPR